MSPKRQSPLVETEKYKANRYVTIFIFILLILDVYLTLSGIITLKHTLLVVALVEPVILILVIINIRKIISRYRYLKGKGMAGLDALQKSLEIAVPTNSR